jgi:hypothetical protein
MTAAISARGKLRAVEVGPLSLKPVENGLAAGCAAMRLLGIP